MNKKYGPLDVSTFPKQLAIKDYASFVKVQENELLNQYMFSNKQMKTLIKAKPSVLLFEKHDNSKGITAVFDVLQAKGMKKDLVAMLIY